jgi:hypothetical protein
VYGVHESHINLPSRGLKGEAKARADAAVLAGCQSNSLFDEFQREKGFDRNKVLTVSLKSIEDPIKEKRKLENRMRYIRMKQKHEEGACSLLIATLMDTCKAHAITIGDFYDQHKDLCYGYPMNGDDDCDALRFVHILEFDVGERPDGKWNFVIFTVTSAARSARLAADLCKNCPLGECTVCRIGVGLTLVVYRCKQTRLNCYLQLSHLTSATFLVFFAASCAGMQVEIDFA